MWNNNLGNAYYSGAAGGGGYGSQGYAGGYSSGGRNNSQYHQPAAAPAASNYATRAPRVFTGHVTKLQDTFGIIDNDVFFQFSVVKGKNPVMGDKVLVEAVYNGDLPFKWHATSVQSLGGGGGGASYSQRGGAGASRAPYQASSSSVHSRTGAAPYDSGYAPRRDKYEHGRGTQEYDSGYSKSSYDRSSNRSGGTGRRDQVERSSERSHDGRSRGVADNRAQRDRREDVRSSPPKGRGLSSDKYHQRKTQARSRTPPHRSPDKSRKRSRSRDDRSTRGGRKSRDGSSTSSRIHEKSRDREQFKRVSLKYNVKPPRYPLDVFGLDVTEVKRRFEGLSIPSNFAHVKFSYQTTFPVGQKRLDLAHHVKYFVMDASTENPDRFEPAVADDTDPSFSVVVMLLSSSSVDDIYSKCCKMNGSSGEKLQHLTKAVSFLLPHKSNKDLVLLGGAWSPSLDGKDPEKDPGVLIKTAIRTVKNQTGVDLSGCANWYTLAELYTVCPGDKFAGQPDTTQRRVVFLPDVWSIMPSADEWSAIQDKYRQFGEDKALELEPPPSPEAEEEQMEVTDSTTAATSQDLDNVSDDEAIFANQEEEAPYAAKNKTPTKKAASNGANNEGASPTLTPSSLKVAELRKELEMRNLDTKGLKPALVARLEEAMAKEGSDKPVAMEDQSAECTEATAADPEPTVTEEVDGGDAALGSDEVTLEEAEEELLPVSEGDKPENPDAVDGAKMGVSLFLKQQEDKQKEEAERLQREIEEEKQRVEKEQREERERKEREEKEKAAAKAREEKERLAKERKEKQDAIRKAYTLPDEPAIVVHALEGQVCKPVAYNTLLDRVYGETKETTFVLEIFAETLFEMLQRDFAYEVFRALVAAPDPEIIKRQKEEAEKKAAEEKKAREEEERKKKEAEEAAKKEAESDAMESSEQQDAAEGSEEPKQEAAEDAEIVTLKDDEEAPPSKKMKPEGELNGSVDPDANKIEPITDDEADVKEEDVKKEAEEQPVVVKKKMVYRTVYPKLLLAFSFFDRSFSGYIKERDMEDMIESLGMAMSRQQVRDLVKKVSKLELINYHELTDDKFEEGVHVEYKYHTDCPLGNRAIIEAKASEGGTSDGDGDFVQYRGQAVNLAQVMAQIEQFTQLNTKLQSHVLSLEKDNDELKKRFDDEALESATLKKKLTDTKSELEQKKSTNSLLLSTQESLKKLLQANVSTFEASVKNINKKLEELNPPPQPKTEEAAAKAGSDSDK